MNDLKRKLLAKALGDDYQMYLDRLYKALDLYPEGCLDLVDDLKELFKDLSDVKETSSSMGSDTFDDYRFRYLLINNYRKFGKPLINTEYYGLSFCEGKEIKNLFLLGNNGSGKSSLFNSMEYACTGKIGEAEYRGIHDLEWYVHRYQESNPKVRICTNNGEFDLESALFKEVTGLDVHRFFFSENSIYELSSYMTIGKETDQTDWVPFFCYAWGLEDILAFIDGTYRRDRGGKSIYEDVCDKLGQIQENLKVDVAKLRKETQTFVSDACLVLSPNALEVIEGLNNNLSSLLNEWEELSVLEILSDIKEWIPDDILYIASLNEFRDNINKLYNQCRLSRKYERKKDGEDIYSALVKPNVANVTKEEVRDIMMNMRSSLTIILNHCHSNVIPFDQITQRINYFMVMQTTKTLQEKSSEELHIEDVLNFLTIFKQNIEKELADFIKKYVDQKFIHIIEATLKGKFINAKDEHLRIAYDSQGSVFKDFGISLSVNEIPVNKYFNTFRFRLFTLCLLSAFNFKAMEEYHFRFPFIFDDIFYANDYRNKGELYNFFMVLEDVAAQFLRDKTQLQVIFFTHDEQFMGTLRFNKDEFFTKAIMARLMDKDYVESISGDTPIGNELQESFFELAHKLS